jgi:hypothetical protein
MIKMVSIFSLPYEIDPDEFGSIGRRSMYLMLRG